MTYPSYLFPLFIIALFIAPVSSAVVRVGQGDDVYINETADLSLAASWPDFVVAYCGGGSSGCEPPDQVINLINGSLNIEKTFVDPKVFRLGTYWRWDGKWHPAEYAVAFNVKAGKRPAVIQEIPLTRPEKNETINITRYNRTNIVIARGETILFEYDTGGSFGSGHFWMFGGEGQGTFLADIQMNKNGNLYNLTITEDMSKNLTVGLYKGFLQFDGNNMRQDAFLDANANSIDSPYKAVRNISLFSRNAHLSHDAFFTIANDTNFSDDILVPVSMQVADPMLMLTDYYEKEDSIILEGKTNFCEGAKISVIADPDHWVLDRDIRANTYRTSAYGGYDKMRTFYIEVPLNWDEISNDPNAEHRIEAKIEHLNITASVSKDFKVGLIFVKPTPIIVVEKVIVDEYGWHKVTLVVPTPATVTPVSTPAEIQTPEPELNITVTMDTVGTTGLQTPVETQPLPVENTTSAVPDLSAPSVVVPMGLWGVIAGLIIIVVMRRP